MNEATCCPTATDCINPIIKAFKLFSFAASYEVGLNEGLVLTHSGDLCCPDCIDPEGYYFLGGMAPYTSLIEGIVTPYPCCVNRSLTAVGNDAFDALVGPGSVCCDTDFSEAICILRMLGVGYNDMVEASSFNSLSGLGIFLNYADIEGIDNAQVLLFLNAIITEGLVIRCTGCQIFIGSVSAFLTYNT